MAGITVQFSYQLIFSFYNTKLLSRTISRAEKRVELVGGRDVDIGVEEKEIGRGDKQRHLSLERMIE